MAGVEAVTFFADRESLPLKLDSDAAEDASHMVPAGFVIADIELFDAAFFAMSPREAEITDPQHRLLMECAWEALESAGYAADIGRGDVGVYVGAGPNTYLLNNVYANPGILRSVSPLHLLIANEKDYLASRISYKFDLKGPSIVVQSACSTSLLAVHSACRALFGGECDLALAGGVSLECPQNGGYQFETGGIFSPDGHCRPFSAEAGGTVRGNGAGIVVLKRLTEAIADRDTIYAVIKGSATNNDGAAKVGYAAPSIEGQSRVICAAQAAAEVAADTIDFVEAHGTATALGDPIEIAALAQAFGPARAGTGACLLGSIKSNIGHLDAAAGVTGLIKAALALHHERIPATLHFTTANPAIDFGRTPFRVTATCEAWPRSARPRRAGISSFGIGGSNVHVVLEEAPRSTAQTRRPSQPAILRLSASTPSALDLAAARLAIYLRAHSEVDLRDVGFTLHVGRKPFAQRMAIASDDVSETIRLLEAAGATEVARGTAPAAAANVAFLFPGQGTQFLRMAGELYREEPDFRSTLASCAEILRPSLGLDLVDALYPEDDQDLAEAAARLGETWLTQPALFAVEYALARLWMAWGLRPVAMIGHSIGEYVAACVAGVLDLENALHLVCARGRLLQDLPSGAMLAVSLSEGDLRSRLGNEVSLAAINRPGVCVVSGPTETIAALRLTLEAEGVGCQALATSHAFHSAMVEPCLPSFTNRVAALTLRPPTIPFISNLSGTWITPEQATSPHYWAAHLRGTVRFADGLRTLIGEGAWALVECGPGQSLSAAAREVGRRRADVFAVASLPKEGAEVADRLHLARTCAQLWCRGITVERTGETANGARIALPTYPFERKRHWIEPTAQFGLRNEPLEADAATAAQPSEPRADETVEDSSLEGQLARLWGEALGVARIAPNDDFFALGGDSILSMQIAHRARGFGVHIRPSMILEHPTIARLAAAIAAERPTRSDKDADEHILDDQDAEFAAALVAAPQDSHETFPLTDIQHAYWIGRGAVVGFGNVAAHSYEEFDCVALDLPRLEAALRGLIKRHPMLRAVVSPDGAQRVLLSVPDYRVEATNLRDLDPFEIEQRLDAIRQRKSHQVLPSDIWPLFDISASLLPGGSTRLHVSFDLLIADAWSIALFWRELERRYGDPTDSPAPLTVTFRDYVLAEDRLQASPTFQRARNYWLDRAADFPGAPGLPLARQLDAIKVPRFVRRSARIEPAAWSALKSRAGQVGLTPSVLLCAAYVEVLAAWSETPRFCLNLPAFNRLPIHPDIGEVIGDFTSVLLLEADTSADEPFLMRAQALQRRLWDDLAHLQFSGVKMLRSIAANRRTGPTMPIVFTSLIFPGLSDAPAGGTLGRLTYGVSQTPQVWLDCQVYEETGALMFNWDSVEDLFEPAMIETMFDAFHGLLMLLAETEDAWTSVEWRARWGETHSGTARAAANATNAAVLQTILHAPFLDRAATAPDAIAVITDDRTLTYGQVAQGSATAAACLRKAGASSGARVAVVMEKGWEQVVAVFAVLRAGGAYIPLDPGLPAERLRQLLDMASVDAVITLPALDRDLEWPVAVPRIVVDAATLEADAVWTDPPIDADSLAYVIFTSGTTGVPKGVMITHRAASNTIWDIDHRFAVGSTDRVLALSSLGFDLSVYDIFGVLAVGGALVMPRATVSRDPAHWLSLMIEAGVTLWNSVPALMELLASHVEQSDAAPLMSLRLVMLSGDWIALGLPDRVRAFAANAELVSLGGATEASIWSIFHVIGVIEPDWRSIPYGKPLANQRFYVLDQHLRPRPDLVPGDLYIGGAGLALGYLGNLVETAARFFVHPTTGETLYRTGDLGRWLPDGSIEFLGRTDTQVKINGFRIETGEIDKILSEHPALRACVTIAAGDNRRARRLVSYVCSKPGLDVDADDLRAYAARRLPRYMVPAVFVEVADLPLSANGKVDRSRLPDTFDSEASRECVAPETATESRLADLWREILGVDELGLVDDFFELGGDSKQATDLITRVRAEFVGDFPLRAVFDTPTIRGLAGAVDEAVTRSIPAQRLGPVRIAACGLTAPLASGQLRMWFHDQLEPGSSTYNIVEPFRLLGPLNIEAMQWSLDAFVRRHDALRTTFRFEGDMPVQSVDDEPNMDFEFLELSRQEGCETKEGIARFLAAQAVVPFDITAGPHFRTRLLRLADEDHVLIVSVHHIVWDAWSTATLIEELSALYRAFLGGEPPTLDEPALRFGDFAIWEQEQLRSGAYRAQIEYWSRQLNGPLPVLALPTDRCSPPAGAADGARVAFVVEASTAQTFKNVCQRRGATLFMGLLAAWQTLLHWWCDQDDIVVGVPSANREHSQLTNVVGFFVNSLAMRTRFDDDMSFAELLGRVRETAVDAYANQDVPFDRLVEDLRIDRRASETAPVFRAWFVLHNVPRPPWLLPGIDVATLDATFLLAVHDIKLSIVEQDAAFDCGIDYRTSLFGPAKIEGLTRCFMALIESIAVAPNTKLSDLNAILDRAWRRSRRQNPLHRHHDNSRDLKKARRIVARVEADGR